MRVCTEDRDVSLASVDHGRLFSGAAASDDWPQLWGYGWAVAVRTGTQEREWRNAAV